MSARKKLSLVYEPPYQRLNYFDCSEQKLENNLCMIHWHYSELNQLITINSCSQISCIWNVQKPYGLALIFYLNFFFSNLLKMNLLLKIIIYCVTDLPSITESQRSIVNFKFSLLTFLKSMSCFISIEQTWNIVWREIFSTLIYVQCYNMYQQKVCVRVYLVWLCYSTQAIQEWKSCTQKICQGCKHDWINGCKTLTVSFPARSIWTHGLVVKASSSKSGKWGLFPAGFVWQSVHWNMHFFILLQYL